MYLPAIRAAKAYQQRPTAMLFHDPLFGHRNPWSMWLSGEPDEPDPDLANVWTEWDFLLADVEQTIADYTDPETGQYMPYDQSGDVYWDVKARYSGSQAALEEFRKGREAKPGESLFAVPTFRDPDNKPTLESWAKDLEENKADGRPSEFKESRPPTAEELAALQERKKKLKEPPKPVDSD